MVRRKKNGHNKRVTVGGGYTRKERDGFGQSKGLDKIIKARLEPSGTGNHNWGQKFVQTSHNCVGDFLAEKGNTSRDAPKGRRKSLTG